jgi:hypothetical protein
MPVRCGSVRSSRTIERRSSTGTPKPVIAKLEVAVKESVESQSFKEAGLDRFHTCLPCRLRTSPN